MSLNIKDVKIIDFKFREIASRLLNCDYLSGLSDLKKFIKYIDDTELISDFVQSKITAPEDFTDWKEGIVYKSMGDTDDKEISSTYNFLKYVINNNIEYYRVTSRYGKNTADSINVFNHRIIKPFVNHIIKYLTELMIKMGGDDNVKYNITISGGQLNIAQDNAMITAIQNNEINVDDLKKLIDDILKSMPTEISDEDSERIKESMDVITDEIKTNTPKKKVLKIASRDLEFMKNKFSNSVNFSASVATLLQFLQQFIA